MAVYGEDTGGAVIAGRYRIGARLGRGGMGTVWRAEDMLLAREVAVKELHLDAGLTSVEARLLRERTVREARTVAQVAHPNVLVVHDVVEQDGRPWIVMELIDGRSLAEQIGTDGPLSAREAARIGLALLGALRAAHARGVQHRDLKPANVLVESGTGRVVLMDFGIAQVPGATTISQTGAFVGSPEYTAPERMEGRPNGHAADLWSLGVLMCAAVEGRTPFQRDNLAGVLHAVAMAELELPDSVAPLRPLVEGLLQREPASRLGADEAERLLRAYLDTGSMPTGEPESLSGLWPAPGPDGAAASPTDGSAGPQHWPEAGGAAGSSAREADTPVAPVRPGGPAPRAGRGRILFVAALLAAGVLGGGVAAAVLLGTAGGGGTERDGGQEQGGKPSPGEGPGGNGPGKGGSSGRVPEGYRMVDDASGFRGAVPAGFTRSYEPPRVYYYSPGKDIRIGVHIQDAEARGAVAVMRQAHQEGPRNYRGYRDGSVRTTRQHGQPGAVWTFVWDGTAKDGGPRQTYDQSWDEAGKMYDVWVSAPVGRKVKAESHFRTLLRTFARTAPQ